MLVRLGSLASATALAAAGAWLLAPTAHADVTEGHCTTSTGVTVVVDFQELGGGTLVRCVEDVAEGTTGLQILYLAGLSPEGTINDGPSFMCRVAGRPSATETLPVTGTDGYRESCVHTPPRTAFWSYWYADNGGSWTFSNLGGSAHEAIIGGYEGWSFSLNNTDSTNPAPGVKPSHTVPKPTPSAAPTTAKPPTVAPPAKKPAPTSQAPTTRPSASTPTQPTPAPASSSAGVPAASSTPTPSASASASASVASSEPSVAGSASTEPTPSTPSPSAAPMVTAETASGVPMGTLLGAGAVAALGAAGGMVWWRRRGL